MPFYLSLSSFLMSMSFCAYGMFNWDAFVYVSKQIFSFYCKNLSLVYSTENIFACFPDFEHQVPNGIGVFLGITQLGLYSYYSNKSSEDREPLIVSYS